MGEEAEDISLSFLGKTDYIDSCMKEVVRKYAMVALVRKVIQPFYFTTGNWPFLKYSLFIEDSYFYEWCGSALLLFVPYYCVDLILARSTKTTTNSSNSWRQEVLHSKGQVCLHFALHDTLQPWNLSRPREVRPWKMDRPKEEAIPSLQPPLYPVWIWTTSLPGKKEEEEEEEEEE